MIARRLLMGGGGSFLGSPRVVDLTAAPAGGWIWYNAPMAVYHNGKVYFTYVRGDNGHGEIRTFTEATEVVSSAFDLRNIEIDDHASPTSVVRESDARIIAFYSAHNGSGEYHRISTNPEDITAWATEVNLDSTLGGDSYTYTQPIQLTGETDDPIYLFYRESSGSTAQWHYTKSTDSGATWSAPVLVLSQSSQAPYLKAVRNGTDRIDFVATEKAPAGVGVTQISVWHAYYQGGSWFESDGTGITLPLSAANMTLVYDGSTVMAQLEDIAIGTDGHPRIVYTRAVDLDTDHRYDYARWTGSAWDVNEMCGAGGGIGGNDNWYSGGIAIDRLDASIVYASRDVTGQFEMYRFVTADGGSTFSSSALTSGSASRQIRPTAVDKAHAGGLRCLWMAGTYTGQSTFNCGTRGAVG